MMRLRKQKFLKQEDKIRLGFP